MDNSSQSKFGDPALPFKIATGIVGFLALVFIGLFIWMTVNYTDSKTNLDEKIKLAVAEAVDENTDELEADFAEREKYPYETFAGPADYGELSFEYPKTWSVFIEADASNGGDYAAYFNPGEVNPVSNSTVNALRVSILEDSYETVIAKYNKEMAKKSSDLTVETITVGGTTATKYTGTIPSSDLSGYIVIFKIRDKAVILQTDSVLFKADFDRLLSTVTFNS